MINAESMDFTISNEAYQNHLKKRAVISNSQLRPDGEDFFDALMSVNMAASSEGQEILETIRALN